MLKQLQRVANYLLPLKPVMSLMMLLAFVLFMADLFTKIPGFDDEVWLMPAGAGMLWAFFLWLFVSAGSSIPAVIDDKSGWIRRVVFRIKRGYFYILALFILLGLVGITFISLRFIRIIMAG